MVVPFFRIADNLDSGAGTAQSLQTDGRFRAARMGANDPQRPYSSRQIG
jgi:hypothetical protein